MKKLTLRNLVLSVVLAVLVPLGVLAANLTIPNTFTPGTPINASEMNATGLLISWAIPPANAPSTARRPSRIS